MLTTRVNLPSSAGYYYYRCTKSRTDEASDCPKGKLFTEKEIEGIVFRAIMQMLAMCQERKKQKSPLMLTRRERIAACLAELQKLGQQQERYKQEKFRAYENFNAGGLTKDAYMKQRAEIDSKIASAKAEQDNQEQLLAELEQMVFQDKEQDTDFGSPRRERGLRCIRRGTLSGRRYPHCLKRISSGLF